MMATLKTVPASGDGTIGRVSPATILDLLPGLVSYFDTDLRYLYANAAYGRWRGLEPSEMLGKYVRDVVGGRNYPLIAANLRRALAGEQVVYEYHIFDGEHARRVQGSYVPDRDDGGHVVGVVALVTDISKRDDLQIRIAQSEAMFNEAFENAPIGKAIVDIDGVMIRSNAAFAAMLGRPRAEMEGLRFAVITHPDDIGADLEHFANVIEKKSNGYCMEKRYIRADGSFMHARLAVSAVRNDSGDVVRFLAHVEDVTQQHQAERQIIQANARLSLVSEALRGGSWHMELATGQFQTSEALARFICGAPAGPLDLDAYRANIVPDDLGQSDMMPMVEGRVDRSSVEYRLRTSTGIHWMRCDRRLLRDAEGRPSQIVGVTIDMTEEHERRLRAEIQASTDPLTGLLNRRGLEQKLESLSVDTPCGVLAVDLDGFKQVNDRLGHDAGDAVLVEAAARLQTIVRDSDLVARVGGDEFVLVLVNADLSGLTSLAARATASLQRRFRACTDTNIPVGGSIGAAWSPRSPIAENGVMAHADAALYEAKAAGRGTWRLAA